MKKMRKLVPAFAMLMVAAIMMSTASFAWFTMNESVTATGMTVQAKASGNLLISTAPLTAASQDISVELDSTKKNLSPVTYDATAWKIPSSGKLVDPTYGTLLEGATLATVNASDIAYGTSAYFSDYTVYLATAGDSLSGQEITVSITGIAGANFEIAPAYSIAFYVVAPTTGSNGVASWADPDWGSPNATVSLLAGTGKCTGTFTLPSTYGINAETKTGVKVVMRVYVDGNLKKGDQTVYTNTIVQGSGKYNPTSMSAWTFYTDSKGQNKVSDVNMWTTETDISGYYYWDGTTQTSSTKEVKYVNNATIPTGSTTFEVEFKAGTPST